MYHFGKLDSGDIKEKIKWIQKYYERAVNS